MAGDGAALFLATLVCFSFAFVNAAHAASIAGTHGTLHVEKCWQDKGSRRSGGHTVRGGTFRSDDGKSVDEMAQVSAKFEPGSRVSVQQSSDRYVRKRQMLHCEALANGQDPLVGPVAPAR